MKILRLFVALVVLAQAVLPAAAETSSLPYSLVDKDQYDIFAEEQADDNNQKNTNN